MAQPKVWISFDLTPISCFALVIRLPHHCNLQTKVTKMGDGVAVLKRAYVQQYFIIAI